MKKPLLLTAFAALLTAMPASADYRSVTVRLNDNTTLAFDLNDDLTVRFNDLEMTIQSPDLDKTVVIRKENIAGFEHSTTAAISDISSDTTAPVLTDGAIRFSSLPEGSTIRIFEPSGRLLRETSASGDLSLPVAELGSGSFIITVNNSSSFKIAIR